MRQLIVISALVLTGIAIVTACGTDEMDEIPLDAGAPPDNGVDAGTTSADAGTTSSDGGTSGGSVTVANNIPMSSSGYTSFSSASDVALIFQATSSARSISGMLYLYRGSATTVDTATYDVKLYSVTAGKPVTALATLVSGAKFSALSTSLYNYVVFSGTSSLSAGSSYAIVVTSSASSATGRWANASQGTGVDAGSSTLSAATRATSSSAWTTTSVIPAAKVVLTR